MKTRALRRRPKNTKATSWRSQMPPHPPRPPGLGRRSAPPKCGNQRLRAHNGFFSKKSDLSSQMFQRQRAPKMANWPFCGCHSSKKERGENLAKVVLERKRVEMLSAEMPGSWDQVVVLKCVIPRSPGPAPSEEEPGQTCPFLMFCKIKKKQP